MVILSLFGDGLKIALSLPVSVSRYTAGAQHEQRSEQHENGSYEPV